jgi:HK97 gp10 family phage protein
MGLFYREREDSRFASLDANKFDKEVFTTGDTSRCEFRNDHARNVRDMIVKVNFEGGEALAKTLNSLPDAYSRKVILAALKEGGEPIRAMAAQLAPLGETENLSENMTISVTNQLGSTAGGRWRARDETEHAVAVGPSKHEFYGLFQEYGTVHHGAQPFLRPAFDAQGQTALTIIGDALWWALRKMIPSGLQQAA